ncbi:unnamed protein product, partial [Mesorhabditis belari]|uniref:SET domain-containing protein n=1 Tax=Mesorhabditis belari TaxID=2138241 RepID=A0AAF3J8K6_9BILA
MSSVKEESKPVVSKAGKKRVHRRQRAKEQGTADSDRSNDEDESARETAAGKKRRQNPMLQTLKFARLRNVARRVIKKLLNKQKDFPRFFLQLKDAKWRWLLLKREFNWNTIIDGKAAKIFIENWSGDWKAMPRFKYITKNRHSEDAVRIFVRTILAATKLANARVQLIDVPRCDVVVECGEHCKCDPITCRQRVLQEGRQIPLVLWERRRRKGWGLRTIFKIPKNVFVGEYVGEVITFAEAKRGNKHTKYQFSLSTAITKLDNKFLVIDATSLGNETRFINHSCNPNLVAKLVITNKYSEHDFRIGLYSMRDIEPGEELTLNYYPTTVKPKNSKKGRTKCWCDEKKCRGWLPAASE